MNATAIRQSGALWVIALLFLAAPRLHAARPDVVILLTDQQRADELSFLGTPGASTPHFDSLAQNGVLFSRAYCATPQCSPARAALWTGRYPHRTGVAGNVSEVPVPAGMSPPLSPQIASIGKVFAAAGYQTAYFGKWHLGGTPGDHGFALHGGGKDDEAATRMAVEFLTGSKSRAPILLIVSWINPHDIYAIDSAPALTAGALDQVRLPESLEDDLLTKPVPQRLFLREDQGKPFQNYSAGQWRSYIAHYHQLTSRVDAQAGEVLRALEAKKSDPVIVFSSDHGDLAGAHGLPFKGPALYEELVRVPLVISSPKRFQSSTNDVLVSHIDLLPTLCELAGVPKPHGIDGLSLAPLLKDPAASLPRDHLVIEYYGKQNWRVPIRMLRTSAWKIVLYLGYGSELYDLDEDPHELRNLANDPAHAARFKELSLALTRWISDTWDDFDDLTVTDRHGSVLHPALELAAVQEPGLAAPDILVLSLPHAFFRAIDSSNSFRFTNGRFPALGAAAHQMALFTGLHPHQLSRWLPRDASAFAETTAHPLRLPPALPRLLESRGYLSASIGLPPLSPGFDFGFALVETNSLALPDAVARLRGFSSTARTASQPLLAMIQVQTLANESSRSPQSLAPGSGLLALFRSALPVRPAAPEPLIILIASPSGLRSAAEDELASPIVLHWPGRLRPGENSGLVTPLDLAPTLLHAAGITTTGYSLPGESLIVVAETGALARPALFGAVYDPSFALAEPLLSLEHLWMREGDWKLVTTISAPFQPRLLRIIGSEEQSVPLTGQTELAQRLAAEIDRWWWGK